GALCGVDRSLYAGDCRADGVAAAGVFRQDAEDARAAGNGAADLRAGGVLRHAAHQLSLACAVSDLRALSAEPAAWLAGLPQVAAQRSRTAAGGRRQSRR